MHAIGDRAVRNALDAVAGARARRTGLGTTGTTSPTCRSCSRRTCRGSRGWTWSRTARPTGHSVNRRWRSTPSRGSARNAPTCSTRSASFARSRGPTGDGQRLAGHDGGSAAEQMEVAIHRVDPGRSRRRALPAVRTAHARPGAGRFTAGTAYVNHDAGWRSADPSDRGRTSRYSIRTCTSSTARWPTRASCAPSRPARSCTATPDPVRPTSARQEPPRLATSINAELRSPIAQKSALLTGTTARTPGEDSAQRAATRTRPDQQPPANT